MSRSRKSRKPPTEPKAKPKLSKEALATIEKRIRKKTGKKPGNRQQEAQQVNHTDKGNAANKDPRIGSKKPIALGGTAVKAATKPAKTKAIKTAVPSDIAAIRYVEQEAVQAQSPAQALEAIENDAQLQTILAKQEDEQALTEVEVNYYNEMMARHQTLTEQLDLDEDEADVSVSKNSADDLWDKLDNASDDFSKFE